MKIGFDFGGSLIKVSLCCEQDEVELLKSFKHRITHQFTHKKLFFINGIFKRSEFDLFCEFIKEILPRLGQPYVVCTGGGVVDKNKELIELFGDLEIEPLSEFKSIIEGISYFAKLKKDFIYSIDDNFNKTSLDYSKIHPFLLVNIGTGISIHILEKDKATYIGGTTLGGSSLLGFSNILQGNKSFEQIRTEVDKERADESFLFEREYEKLMKGEPVDGKEELQSTVSSFFFEIINNICTIAYFIAKQHKIRRVLFIGNFLKNNKVAIMKVNRNFAENSEKYNFDIEVR